VFRWRRPFDAWRQRRGPYAPLFRPYRGDQLVAIDLETTGLDPANANILSLAAVPLSGQRVETSRALNLRISDVVEIGIDSMRHHRLRRQDLAGGVTLDEALERFLALVGNRPLLGYCVGFDIALLDREIERRHGFRLPNRRVELTEVFERQARRRAPEHEPALSFDAIAHTLGVPQLGRHDAYGDALTAALCYLRLQARG
jgi:DNA polymerase-3 subunit epsilon